MTLQELEQLEKEHALKLRQEKEQMPVWRVFFERHVATMDFDRFEWQKDSIPCKPEPAVPFHVAQVLCGRLVKIKDKYFRNIEVRAEDR